MIEDAFSYPFQGEEATKSLLIGSAIIFAASTINFLGSLLSVVLIGFLFFPIAFVVALPLTGYFIAVLRTTVQGYDQPPVFQDWETLFVDGLKATVITFVYALVPSMIFFGAGFFLLLAGGAVGDAGGGILGGLGLVFFLLAVPVYLVVGYVTPAALTNFAVEGEVGAAFDFETILAVITDADYLAAAVVALLVNGVASFVGSFLAVLLVGFVVIFYGLVVANRLYATAYRSATADRRRAGDSPPPTVD